MIKNRDFLLSELFGRQALNFDERAKIDFHTVLLSYIVIRRLLRSLFGLRNEDFFYFQCTKNLKPKCCSL